MDQVGIELNGGWSLGSPPKKLIRPPIPAVQAPASWAAWTGAATMTTSAPWPACFIRHELAARSSWAGINHPVGAQARPAQPAPAVGLADHHAPRAAQLGQLGVHDADRSGAHHQHHLAGSNVECILTAQHAGKGLDQRGHGRIHPSRPASHCPADGRGRNAHILGKTAVHGDPDGLVIGAQVVVAGDALPAVTAAHIGCDKNTLPEVHTR